MQDIPNKNHYSPVRGTNTTVENIVKTYRLIHTYFFTYAIFIVTIIIGAIVFRNMVKINASAPQTESINYEFIIKQKELIGAFKKQLKQNTENKEIQIQFIQGYINSSGDYIESSNNLAIYK